MHTQSTERLIKRERESSVIKRKKTRCHGSVFDAPSSWAPLCPAQGHAAQACAGPRHAIEARNQTRIGARSTSVRSPSTALARDGDMTVAVDGSWL